MEAMELEVRGRPAVERGVLHSDGCKLIVKLCEGFQSRSEAFVSRGLSHNECRRSDMQKRLPLLTQNNTPIFKFPASPLY